MTRTRPRRRGRRGEVLEPPDDHVAVGRVELHGEPPEPLEVACHQGGPGAGERIEHRPVRGGAVVKVFATSGTAADQQDYPRGPVLQPGEWNNYEIHVAGQ